MVRCCRELSVLLLLCHGMIGLTGSALAEEPTDAPPSPRKGWEKTFSPGEDLYPRYIADPKRPTFALTRASYSRTDIDAVGDKRTGLRIGGRYGLYRFHGGADDLQIDIEVGFLGQFDLTNSADLIGWDGVYGFHLAWARWEKLALRFGYNHDSSHVGDEYIEDTGRTRINYTREEFLLGASWSFAPGWDLYGEVGYGIDLRNRMLQEKGRLQAGLQYEAPAFWKSIGWYAALDLSAFQESDWDLNTAVQSGFVIHKKHLARVFRLGLEFYDGRSPIGEFFQDGERYVAIGLWFDL